MFKFILILLVPAGLVQVEAAAVWSQFRGPGGSPVAQESAVPAHFGPKSNVLWQTSLPPGSSSPVIWGDRIFLTAFDQPKLETLCLDRRNGNILWRRAAPAEKIESCHKTATPAASTPVTDGQRVYAYFGSFGLLAYEFDGAELWRQPLPAPMVEFGTGASPILADDLLILVCDQDLGSYLLAVQKQTGQTVWRKERPEFRRSFATPFVWRHDGVEELIVSGSIWLKSYNLKDGSERWTVSGTARVACASPSAGDGLLFSSSWNVGGDEGAKFTMQPFEEYARTHDLNKDGRLTLNEVSEEMIRSRFSQMDLNKDGQVTPEEWKSMAEMFARAENALLAIRPGGQGEIGGTHVAWKVTRSLPYVSSPLYHQGRVYTVKSGGLVSCYHAKTGKPFYQDERLGAVGDYYASSVAAGDKVIICSLSGVVNVLQAADTLTVLARNNLGETISATPAIVDGKIFLRTAKKLYCFGNGE